MRGKQLIAYLPGPSTLKLVYSRITSSKLTLAFFLVSVLHFIFQISFQGWAFSINASASTFLSSILTAGGLQPHDNFAVLIPGGELRLCSRQDLVSHKNIYQCEAVWKGRTVITNGTLDYDELLSTDPVTSVSAIPASRVDGSTTRSSSTTSSITTLPTLVVTKTPGLVQPTRSAAPIADEPKREDEEDDEDDDDDDDDEEREDKVKLSKRHELANVPRVNIWRRNSIPIVPITNANAQNIVGTASTSAVSLPTMRNSTTQTLGVVLSKQCVQMILWPNQIIHNTKREDVTFMAFQFWVLGMSIVAILNESIPHIGASLFTHILATIWSAYQMYNTASFQEEFVRSTIRSGLCTGANLLPGYWKERRAAEIAVLVVNCVSLLVFAFLSWRLIKTFGWQTFKRIGASCLVNRVYKIVLTFSIGLQLTFFFIIASMGIWMDLLCNTVLGSYADLMSLYQAFSILACIIMVPWLWLGWTAVRHETERWMTTFLVVCLLLVAGWAALFGSQTFRWQFNEWRFFSTIIVIAGMLLMITTLLGVVCFYNFGKGLKTFLLEAENDSFDPSNFTNITSRDVEKQEVVGFPVSGPIPTYAVAFGHKSNTKQDDSDSARSSWYSGGVGSPLHDPTFLEPVPPGYYSQASSAIPPRFRSQNGSIADYPPTPEAPMTELRQGSDVARSDSTASSESGSQPFSLDIQRSNSNGTSFSGRTGTSNGSNKLYVAPGSHHVPKMDITAKHVRDDSHASSKKGWVIE